MAFCQQDCASLRKPVVTAGLQDPSSDLTLEVGDTEKTG